MEAGELDPVTGEELAQRHVGRQERIARDFSARRKHQFNLLQSRMLKKREERARKLRERQQQEMEEVCCSHAPICCTECNIKCHICCMKLSIWTRYHGFPCLHV